MRAVVSMARSYTTNNFPLAMIIAINTLAEYNARCGAYRQGKAAADAAGWKGP
jgi:hypothetical protein